VHYVDFGGPPDAPLVVCVHGLGGSYANWLAFAPLLTERARVVAVDLPGFGRTPAAGQGTDVGAYQRLLGRFITVTGGPAVLVGNSMGGLVSLLQAGADEGSVAGLTLISPALAGPRGPRPHPEIAWMFAVLLLPWVGMAALARRRARFSAAELVAETLDRCTADPSRVPAEVVAALVELHRERVGQPGVDQAYIDAARSVVYALARPKPLARAVQAVRVPTLLVHGSEDRLIPVKTARHIAAHRPDWRVEILDGYGHLPQLEAATETAALVLDWLDRAHVAGTGRTVGGEASTGAVEL
jgi:pimeloyl-ACP methyl ester carboxylesterase